LEEVQLFVSSIQVEDSLLAAVKWKRLAKGKAAFQHHGERFPCRCEKHWNRVKGYF